MSMFKKPPREEIDPVEIKRYSSNPGDSEKVMVFTTSDYDNAGDLGTGAKTTTFTSAPMASGELDDVWSVDGQPAPDVNVDIERKALNQGEVEKRYDWQPRQTKSFGERIKEQCASCTCSARCVGQTIVGLLPFINTIKNYKPKTDVLPDVVAGLTIGIMQIPQGMAYAQLAGLDAVYGLYTSLFPVVLYFFFGTSRHVSVGTFAVVSLMVGSTVDRFCGKVDDDETEGGGGNMTTMAATTGSGEGGGGGGGDMCRIQVAAAVTFMGGLIQLVMGICRLGFVVKYLSEAMTRGFTTGCAIHVFSSQIKHIFGIYSVGSYSGPWKLVYTYWDLLSDIPSTNPAAIILSAICIVVLWCVKEYLNPPVKKIIKIPIPIDLIVVILGTIWSYYGKLEEKYDINIVGDIPTGIPPPTLPPADRFLDVFADSIAIAIVAFAISVSMVQLFAKRHNYESDSNQELIAHGACNLISCNFNCYMMCVSLSRSVVMESVGVASQISSLYSSALILIVLLFLASLFEPLPSAVLAAIIIVALKGMFMQFKDIPKYKKLSWVDLSVWLVTFIAVVLLDVALGLVVGVLYNLLTVVGRTQRPYSTVEGVLPDTEIYSDGSTYIKAEEVKGIKIFRIDNALYYANVEYFVEQLYEQTGCDAKKITLARMKKKKKAEKAEKTQGSTDDSEAPAVKQNGSMTSVVTDADNVYIKSDGTVIELQPSIHTVIIDCSGISYLDSMGVSILKRVIKEYKEIGVTVFLAGCKIGVLEMLHKGEFFSTHKKEILFPSVHDAVVVAHYRSLQSESMQSLVVNVPPD